jgi:hypothetical protein
VGYTGRGTRKDTVRVHLVLVATGRPGRVCVRARHRRHFLRFFLPRAATNTGCLSPHVASCCSLELEHDTMSVGFCRSRPRVRPSVVRLRRAVVAVSLVPWSLLTNH